MLMGTVFFYLLFFLSPNKSLLTLLRGPEKGQPRETENFYNFFDLVLGVLLLLGIIFKYASIKISGVFEHFSPKMFEICFHGSREG